ncbi:hypothetical protein [Pandoraea pulmonicola]|uniref:Uncharacterized protein n=1 Tax=Pandoraea pulmonicola TaxID=93221 RepID=A0AAJ5D0T5_PANPU|nr:hypothetical protein [Pandoraea pulmonicola]AJC20517.1 hypothetical protein RO07_08580 [Pandoraea pulmonicola]SUA91056.1 Uncharacterised protein [Pandoraea pulmonicola]
MLNKKLFKHYAIALGVVLWLFVVIFAMVKNPSTTDASAKMTMMKADMARMLANGGDVIYRNESAKFGGALLSIMIRKAAWTERLRDMYIETLVGLGWRQTQTGPATFCKGGVIAEIHPSVEDYKGVPVVLIGMMYDATTINSCK